MCDRISQEKATVELMIRLYCRFGPDKPTCRKCSVHCYSNEMRERIRTIMHWAGPRMMVYHPVEAVRHLLLER